MPQQRSSNGDRNLSLSLSLSRKMATSAFSRDASISIADVARKRDIFKWQYFRSDTGLDRRSSEKAIAADGAAQESAAVREDQ